MQQEWDFIIKAKKNKFHVSFGEIWAYRDLWALLVKRDITSFYKQTILGPLWYLLQPIFTTLVYTFVFGKLASISTDDLPPPLFYLVGITVWNYFSACFLKTASIFKDNVQLLGKVYFPRLIMPLSLISSNLMSFFIQMILVIAAIFYYQIPNAFSLHLFLLPILILFMALLGLGLGLIIAALTTTYRDLFFLVQFGIQLFMYATPVIYPSSTIPVQYRFIILANPMTHIVEGFRFALLGKGMFEVSYILYTFVIIMFVLAIGVILFNKAEQTFIDTV